MIKSVAIVGMGALGLMYGEHIQKKAGAESVCFLLDRQRMERYHDAEFSVNSEKIEFAMVDGAQAKPVDLVIVATKYNGLRSAMEVMEKAVGENTVIISVLNGISSEKILAEKFSDNQIIPCVALGMDAMRDGYTLNYCNKGRLCIGKTKEEQIPALDALVTYFDEIQMPYSLEEDIMHAMWGKFLLNVGINQTCMVYDTTYSGALTDDQAREDMFAAMREVITISQPEGVSLTEDDFNYYLGVLKTLNPEGFPSMRQDALAKRRSEVDMFAGTVLEIAKKHNISVPINEKYYKIVQEMESKY
jgi:2-dehydropantoate 2-reductase